MVPCAACPAHASEREGHRRHLCRCDGAGALQLRREAVEGEHRPRDVQRRVQDVRQVRGRAVAARRQQHRCPHLQISSKSGMVREQGVSSVQLALL